MIESLNIEDYIEDGFNMIFTEVGFDYMLDNIKNVAVIENKKKAVFHLAIFYDTFDKNKNLFNQNIYQINTFNNVEDLESFIFNNLKNILDLRDKLNYNNVDKSINIMIPIEDYLNALSHFGKSEDVDKDIEIILDKLASIYATTGSFNEFYNLLNEKITEKSIDCMVKSAKENFNSI